jgi:hypothetical protein
LSQRDDKGRFKPKESGGVVHGLTLPVSATVADILAAVHFGHAQALEMYRALTQPAQQAPVPSQVMFGGEPEDEELEPGMIDIRGLWGMSPEAREAVLARAGLQVVAPVAVPEDPVEKEVEKISKTYKDE